MWRGVQGPGNGSAGRAGGGDSWRARVCLSRVTSLPAPSSSHAEALLAHSSPWPSTRPPGGFPPHPAPPRPALPPLPASRGASESGERAGTTLEGTRTPGVLPPSWWQDRELAVASLFRPSGKGFVTAAPAERPAQASLEARSLSERPREAAAPSGPPAHLLWPKGAAEPPNHVASRAGNAQLRFLS